MKICLLDINFLPNFPSIFFQTNIFQHKQKIFLLINISDKRNKRFKNEKCYIAKFMEMIPKVAQYSKMQKKSLIKKNYEKGCNQKT